MILHDQAYSRVCVTNGLWFLGDDSLYYRARIADAGGGIYLWTTQGPEVCPTDTWNLADSLTGATFWMLGEDNLYHAFRMTPADTPVTAFIWTDFTQQSGTPSVYRRIRNARVDGGLYITNSYGEQFHKLTMLSGLFSESNQGVTIPLA